MTREEEILERVNLEYPSKFFIDGNSYDLNLPQRTAFCLGARWADEHPKDNLVDIDKVCEFIKSNGYCLDYEDLDYDVIVAFDFKNKDELIESLKQAMKG